MTRTFLAALAVGALTLAAGSRASAQVAVDTTSPEITFGAPSNGLDLSTVTDDRDLFDRSKVTVSGTASDATRVAQVQYRVEGSHRWRRATLIRTSSNDTLQEYAWAFRVKISRKSHRRVYIRAYDDAKNESDIIGRLIMRGNS